MKLTQKSDFDLFGLIEKITTSMELQSRSILYFYASWNILDDCLISVTKQFINGSNFVDKQFYEFGFYEYHLT
ncbi:hypothetical protein BpHYR1_031812 [Brachionus plicatilis]|uniref:Uncharacterized protein n=1 Tax=Brachionus plicatilis TaxID=10195 RepID=A0A3M7PGN3_BRAPC|nr:hypothetical protein BpHYR1_031812 [Brachionus plicatilis]